MTENSTDFIPPSHLASLVPYVPGKPIADAKKESGLEDIIKLASNENPLGASPRALKATREALKETFRYPDALHTALGLKLGKKHACDPLNVVIGNGSNEIISLLIRTVCVPGDAILLQKYAFVAYEVCARTHGVGVETVSVGASMEVDLKALVSAATENKSIKLLFLANPNNPTGIGISDADLRKALRQIYAARGNSIVVALDYAYWEYVTDSSISNPDALRTEFPQLVILRTFSKIYGLAGLRLGYGILSKTLAGVMNQVREPFNVNSLALVAGEAALNDREFVRKSRELNTLERRRLTDELKKAKVKFYPSQGNFFLINSSESFGVPGKAFCASALRSGIILRPLDNYGLKDFVRVTIGTRAQNQRVRSLFLSVLK